MLTQPVALCYHRITERWRRPGEHALLGFLDVSRSRLSAQLDALMEAGFRFPPVSELLQRDSFAPSELFITVDDGYATTIRRIGDVCAERRIEPIVFVTGSVLQGASFWWDRVELMFRKQRWSRKQAMLALDDRRNGAKDPDILPKPEDVDHLPARVQELLSAPPNVTFGWHGMYHIDLADAPDDVVLRELLVPDAVSINQRFLRVFAYPFGPGRPIRPRVVGAVEHDFRWGFTLFIPPGKETRRGAAPRFYVSPHLAPPNLVKRVRAHADRLPRL